MEFAGADWIESSLNRDLSPFGRKVADILGLAYAGIYHLPTRRLEAVQWDNPTWMEVSVRGDLSTFDSNRLTVLVIACHEKAVRLEITPANPQYIRLRFHRRKREGSTAERHPTIEEAIANVRRYMD